MPKTTYTEWVCERDGTAVTLETGAQPDGWRGLVLTDPPDPPADRYPPVSALFLCPGCVDALRLWLTPAPENPAP